MKIGFIGTGNMGSSIIKGILSSKFEKSENINIFDLDKEKVNNLVKEYGVNAVNIEKELAENCDIIILSVKPHYSHRFKKFEWKCKKRYNYFDNCGWNKYFRD